MPAADDIATWDAEAASFDGPADHGLRDPRVRAAWRDLLIGLLPPAPARVADLGCGTGTLSVLLADEGYRVDGVDFSPEMACRAEAKADGRAGLSIVVADAANPPLPDAAYDVVLCRHVLWALPDPAAVLDRWTRLLAEDGVLVLVEGRWGGGPGLSAEETVELVGGTGRTAELTRLTDPVLWGGPVSDDRYVVVGRPIRS